MQDAPTDPAAASPSPASASAKSHATSAFPIVGIGASAGGLAAFEAFFAAAPEESGIAFVLVQHLSPEHKSLLSEILRRSTAMPVIEIEDGMPMRPNHVYVIPPNTDLALLDGALHLFEPTAPPGARQTIDYFFCSLAQDQGERAVGIVLSGTGSDGSAGVRAIKMAGGMVMVQTPESAEFPGMPESVVATGLADYSLAPSDMPSQLLAYTAHAIRHSARANAPSLSPKSDSALKKIFLLLRSQVGHDFSHYKPSTIHRRIERRMAVHQIEAPDDYVKYLQQTPAEVEALFRDLLIGVTNFFRDADAFSLLAQQVIPKLFANKPAGSTIRLWSTGCSTGEEAYSLAILLAEHVDTLKLHYNLQVFATDIDSHAIAYARAGVYPASIAGDVSAERLSRFFTAEPSGGAYRIHKSIRDTLVFSEQNVIKDPPFSRLDLISCRNLLIYLDASLQRKLIPLFHYALKPDGVLFLGSSEGVGEFAEQFTVLDRKAKLFQRKENMPSNQRPPIGPFVPPLAVDASADLTATKKAPALKRSLREITEQALLQRFVPVSALVNEQGDILYLHGRSGQFLEPAPGEAGVNNILKMARHGLRIGLTRALHQAVTSKELVQVSSLRVQNNGHYNGVHLTISPVSAELTEAPSSPLFLVMLQDAGALENEAVMASSAQKDGDAPSVETAIEARIAVLQDELRAKDEYLQATHEELESANEELKSSNEEMQSVNEELQSTNEELETSKEELQSVNEELATVNHELQAKVVDLSRANNDMNNLLAGTGIGTVFVDHQLRILRFTPAASSILNLIRGDIGRPVGHIVSNLAGYSDLINDVQGVLDTLISKEVEVQGLDGTWYALRIQPYRTLENVIEGAVISFINISVTVENRDALRKANDMLRLAVVVHDANDAITMHDLEGRTLAWNPGAVRMYGWSEAEALLLNLRERIPASERSDALKRLHELSEAKILAPYLTQRLNKAGNLIDVSVISTALVNQAGAVYAIATTERASHSNEGKEGGTRL